MSAVNTSAATLGGRGGGDHTDRRDALLAVVLERSWFTAWVTDAEAIVQWASPAFRSLVSDDGDPVGQSLFALAGGRAANLAPVLSAVLEAPLRQATADIDLGDPRDPAASHSILVSAENLCSDPDVEGILWWQCREFTPERVDRLTRALANIAREVEWVGFDHKAPTIHVAPIGLLPGAEQLSDRERAVATMVGQGETVSTIASRLFVSPSTVRNYLSSMYRKLEVRDLAALRELLARGGGSPSLSVFEPVENVENVEQVENIENVEH
jgi:DNA-binding CsgD family transcriptional regulator